MEIRPTPTQREILAFIRLIQRPAPRIMRAVFTRGGCYAFALILANRFPGHVTPYTTRAFGGHVVAKIGGQFWDIRGRIVNPYYENGRPRFHRMTPKQCAKAARWDCSWDDIFR